MKTFSRLVAAAVLLAAGLAAAPLATADPPYMPPATVDATGTTDATDALLAFIDSVPDGSTIAFPAGANYRIDGTLDIQYRHNLTFEGNGARFFARSLGDRTRRHFRFLGGSDIVVRDVVVVGASLVAGVGDHAYDRYREAQHGFMFSGVDTAELDGVTVTDIYGDFVYVGKDYGTGAWSKNIWVHDSVFERNGRQGIAVTAGRDVLIEDSRISEIRRATLDLEPNGPKGGAIGITFRNNEVGRGRLLFLAAVGQAGQVRDVKITGNTLRGKVMNMNVHAPDGTRRSNFLIADNVSDRKFGSPLGHLMKFHAVDGVTVTGNYQEIQDGREVVGVRTEDSCLVVVAGNTFPGASAESEIGACGDEPGDPPPADPVPDDEAPSTGGGSAVGGGTSTTTTSAGGSSGGSSSTGATGGSVSSTTSSSTTSSSTTTSSTTAPSSGCRSAMSCSP